jgi:hypothetical protein
MKERKYYIYAYLDPSKLYQKTFEDFSFMFEPFYIGKGKDDRKMVHLRNYRLNNKTHLSNKILDLRNNGIEPIITELYVNLTEEESLDIEKKLISIIGRRILKSGPLVNITDGGEGISGLKHTHESRKKMSNKGEKHPNWNKKLSDTTRKKISDKLKLNNPMKNPEISEKVRLKNIGRTPWNKGISTPEDICKKLSDKKIKYHNIQLISKKDNTIEFFNNIYEVMLFLQKCYRSVYLYLQKNESKEYFIKYEVN